MRIPSFVSAVLLIALSGVVGCDETDVSAEGGTDGGSSAAMGDAGEDGAPAADGAVDGAPAADAADDAGSGASDAGGLDGDSPDGAEGADREDGGAEGGPDADAPDADPDPTDPWACSPGDGTQLSYSASTGSTGGGSVGSGGFPTFPFPISSGTSTGTVMVDGDYFYWVTLTRSADSNLPSGSYDRSGISRRPRDMADTGSATQVVSEDVGSLTSKLFPADDGYVYFVGGQDDIYRIAKAEGADVEGPLASSGSQQWTGPLVVDADAYYVTTSEYYDADHRRYRVLRIERDMPQSRTTLWTVIGDSNTFDEMALHQNDMAITDDHVYFSVRINSNGAPHPFQYYRVNKIDAEQSGELLAEADDTYGGLATDGDNIYYFDGASAGTGAELMQLSLQPSATPVGLGIRSSPPLALSYGDGWLGWRGGSLRFVCP